jgi:hypothetical protein
MRSGVRRLLRLFVLLPILAIAFAASGCKEDDPVEEDPGTTPSQFLVTETFNGTLFKNGAASYSFSIGGEGVVTVTLKTVTDSVNPAGLAPNIGMSLGSWDGISCSVQTGVFTDNASVNASITGRVNGAGILCARVYDPANYVTNPLLYTIIVTHP